MNLSFNTSPKMLLGIAAVILAVLLFCALKVNTNPSGIALTGFIASCVALAVLALYTKIDVVIQVLRDDLEPKTSGTLGPNVAGVQRDHRNDLEYSLVHALAPHLVHTKSAAELGAFIRDAANSIQGRGSQVPAAVCTCGPNDGCSRCSAGGSQSLQAAAAFSESVAAYQATQSARITAGDESAGAVADQHAEAEIVAAGLTAPRVTAEQVQALMDSVTWRYEHEEGSRHTFAHAFLGDFYLATGHNAPVSRENFDAALGMKYAREQGEGKARDKLWELEGYKLHSAIAGQ